MALAHATYPGNEGAVELVVEDGVAEGKLPEGVRDEDVDRIQVVEDYTHLAVERDGVKLAVKDVDGVPEGTRIVVWYRLLLPVEKEALAEARALEERRQAERESESGK